MPTCANCFKTFEYSLKDLEDLAEFKANSPGMTDEELIVVCDDCMKRIFS